MTTSTLDFDDDYVVTCTRTDDDGCASDEALGRCPACDYVIHDIPRDSDTGHDELCCGMASPDACPAPATLGPDENPFAADLCVTHDRPSRTAVAS